MIEKLNTFGPDYSFSRIFFDMFDEMLEMKIKAFYTYLNQCFFQTAQMKKIKYLDLKGNNKQKIHLFTHTSSLIDDNFKKKYCKEDKKLEYSTQSTLNKN
jgi:hypothetical protein